MTRHVDSAKAVARHGAAISEAFAQSSAVIAAVASDDVLIGSLAVATQSCVDALRAGRKLIFAGNGGSAADAQHLAGELVSRFNFDRPALAALALNTDGAILTAIGNDYGYERVFARQVEALAVAGDVLIAISTSGRSPNVLAAVAAARALGVTTIALCGTGGPLADSCDVALRTPSSRTPHIQEGHIVIGHTLCALIEREMCADGA
ncbi:Phosphoheptose isomerase [Luteitalea pratensis]|uniref:Phosphoheptose isomerase n=1 Tax=Luteitalea pratensis TaxID=1855912 RepID=A0A143PTJ3_LUTPR|nr:SIS domain-containing protein [Luteitalea pratensis]AMY11701.1 Phosphoheptose isomerase [Luteitalea pratensis]